MKYRVSKHLEVTGKQVLLVIIATFILALGAWYYIVWIAGQPNLSASQKEVASRAIKELRQIERMRSPINGLMLTRVDSVRTMTAEEIRDTCKIFPLAKIDSNNPDYDVITISYFSPGDWSGMQITESYGCLLLPKGYN